MDWSIFKEPYQQLGTVVLTEIAYLEDGKQDWTLKPPGASLHFTDP
jgi:hypothetical protein